MIISNENYRKLKRHLLTEGDVVIFKLSDDTIRYTVKETFLNYEDGRNDKIFIKLSLSEHQFCEEHYGYPAPDGIWPCFNPEDYVAATNVVIALFEEIKKRENEK